jgi:NADPH-dependent 2,4-dienoyl-CoA reductase/sulfur reductase-like enzyme
LVVGGGSGALGVVDGLKENGYDGPITVISSEGYLPIDRPKLSKALSTDPDKIAWRDGAWYKSGAVDIVDDEVTGVDFAKNAVHTKKGETISYSKLVLSTGGTPRRLPLEGFKTLGNIFTLRTIDDTKKIVGAVGDKGKKIVIIGSSFIGMEVGKALSSGNSISIVGMEKVPLERVLGEEVGAGLQKGLEALGVKFYLSASVEKAEASPADASKVGAVVLKDGTRLEADLVILGVGVAPATAYLKDNSAVSLERDGSLKVNEKFVLDGHKNVYAIGDIATFPYHGPGGDGRSTRIEHWSVAQNAGRAVARDITHPKEAPWSFIPVFWSALSGQLRYCGNASAGWDDIVIQGNPAEGKFVAYYCRGETVLAMSAMGRDPVLAQCSTLMYENKMPSKSQIVGGLDVLTVNVN